MSKVKFGSLLLLFQAILLVLFVVFVDYGDEDAENVTRKKVYKAKFTAFQDVHVMTFLGFGMIMTFLRRYSRGMLVHALLIGGLIIQWATLLQGFFTIKKAKIDMSLERMLSADFAVTAVLISFGAIMGKCNSLQLLIVAVFETFFFAVNEAITVKVLQASDHGRSIVVHLFGAYFGLAVSRMIYSRKVCMSQALSMSNKSEMFAFIGTLFLWVYWPSANALLPDGSARNRAIANTYYALAASCAASYSITVLQSKEGKFNILHLQNATLAGGIAVGAVAGMMLHPWGAIIIGVVSALGSILGYKYIVPNLRQKLKIHDTRGIHAVHGIPGIISGIASIIAALLANEESYKLSLYDAYPARVPFQNSTKYKELQKIAFERGMEPFIPGLNRDAVTQAFHQIAGLGISLGIAIAGGLLTGLVIKIKFFDPVSVGDAFDDHLDFEERNCIDIYTDNEDEGDHREKCHDSIRGNKRLLDDDQHSDIILTSYDVNKGSIANSMHKSDGSLYKENDYESTSHIEPVNHIKSSKDDINHVNENVKNEDEDKTQNKDIVVDWPEEAKENEENDIELKEFSDENKPLVS